MLCYHNTCTQSMQMMMSLWYTHNINAFSFMHIPVCSPLTCNYLLFQAPEIMQGHSYDAKVDLWSVGVILYGKYMLMTP